MLPFLLLTIPISSVQANEPCGSGKTRISDSLCINLAESFPPNHSISSPFCVNGWIYSSKSNKCYRIFPIKLSSYEVAKEFCSSFNASLTTIMSEENQSEIYEISTRGWHPDFEKEFGDFAWMGLSKRKRFHWVWETGKPLGAELWAKSSSEEVTKIWERMCAVYDPTTFAENEIRGAMKPIECEDSEQEVGNVFCEQDSTVPSNTKIPDFCDNGWYFYNETGLCYKVLQGSFPYNQRKNECSRHKSKLVTVKSGQEMDFLANLLTSGWRLPQPKTTKNLVWIGSVENIVNPPVEIYGNESTLCYTIDPQAVTNLNGTKYLGKVGTESCDSNYTHFICSKEKLETDETNFIPTHILIISIILSIISFIFLVAIFSIFMLYRKQQKRTRNRPSLLSTFSRFTHSTGSTEAYPLLEIGNSFKLEDFKLIESIGSGHFGCVFAAELLFTNTTVKVAVKRCRINGDQEQLRCLSSELTAMSKLPMHPNVVALIGSVTTELKKSGQLYTVMELCELKSLLSFVSKFQNSDYVNELEGNSGLDSQYYNINEREPLYMNTVKERKSFSANELRTADLLVFSVQIANGLCHLADNNCIHRDLAARNILLTSDFICKISDFGLARFVEPSYYNTQTPIDSDIESFPQRWMAPESLENNTFSYATDVWSFGIVLFELFSLGKQPYFKFTQNNVRNAVLSGELNEQPLYCHDQIYDLMKRCWDREAMNRPTPLECHVFLKKHLQEAFSARAQFLDEMTTKEATRQRELKDFCRPRTYYNT